MPPFGRYVGEGDRDVAWLGGGERLPLGRRMRAWWRVALATEIAGTMRGALSFTTQYVKERRQFGRAIGSFQAIQHRLADCVVLTEATRWLAYEAAFHGAPDDVRVPQ